MPINTTISVYRGERVTLNFVMTPVIDISGWALVFNLAKAANSPSKIIDDKVMTVLVGSNGTFTVDLTPTELDIKPGSYYWDAWRADTGQEALLALGTFTVIAVAKKPEV